MDYQIILLLIMGGVLGEGMRILSRRLMHRRTGQSAQNCLLASGWSRFVWIAAGAIICGMSYLFIPALPARAQCIGILLVLLAIAVIDNSIRKIPNELIAILLALKITTAVIGGDAASLIPAAFGLAVGFGLFLIPSYLGLAIGWGDIKFAAVAGFCLGFVGILQATLVMAGILIIYLAYLKLTKKGNWKTKVAIGPSLAIGFGFTLLFPIAVSNL